MFRFSFKPREMFHIVLQLFKLIFVASLNLTYVSALSTPSPSSQSHPPPFSLQKLDHIVLRCRDYPLMFDFYTNVLGCTIDKEDDVGRFGGALTHLRAGDAYIDLLAYDSNHLTEDGQDAILKMHHGGQGVSNLNEKMKNESTKVRVEGIEFSAGKSTTDHICLRIEPFDQEAIENFMESQGVNIVGSGDRKGADGTGPSVYVQDPEGNVIELKGPPKKSTLVDDQKSQASDSSPTSATFKKSVSEMEKTQKTIKTNVQSDFVSTPCVRICRYNADFYDGQVCLGCYREAFEIGTWSGMSSIEKYFALLDAADRCPDDDSGVVFEGSTTRNELLQQAKAWKARKQ
mmetsp:Transcript_23734/g.33303  ORF Transcript_23734/g.33303 Transcript_23734/m.33303 type:complete len:345 (+) Transcript_23734:355-1389(+)